MKKIVPFKKDIIFQTNLAEIISISLEHTLSIEEDNMIKGKFIISGEYKMLETSVNTDPFSYELPFVVDMDEKYILDKAEVDIDDFYYEIVNDNILSVHIDVAINHLEEKEEKEEVVMEEKELVRTDLPLKEEESVVEEKRSVEVEEKRCIEEEDIPNLFTQVDTQETYKSYTVYIVRENDTIETILEQYQVTKEELELYNDLSEIKIGDKIIIPAQ